MCVRENQVGSSQLCSHDADHHLQLDFAVYWKCCPSVVEADLDYDEPNRRPARLEVVEELLKLGRISGPIIVTGLLLYLRGMISMQFLGYLGELELAGGSLSIGFSNITGYSVISGLAMGMEP
ncbi:hypothetical protein KI387_002641, partial [Taxus chinensis]